MTIIIDSNFTVVEVRDVLAQLGLVRHIAAGVYRLEPKDKEKKQEARQ